MVLFTHALVMLIGSWFSQVALPLTVLCVVCNAGKLFSEKKSADSNYCSLSKQKENMKSFLCYMIFSSRSNLLQLFSLVTRSYLISLNQFLPTILGIFS